MSSIRLPSWWWNPTTRTWRTVGGVSMSIGEGGRVAGGWKGKVRGVMRGLEVEA